MDNLSNELVKIEGNKISATMNSVAEAKLIIKELKLKKKQYSLDKKTLANQQKQIRAQYTSEVRTRGSMVRGSGTLTSIARTMQRYSRDGRRARLANDLEPFEKKKHEVENILAAIDNVILQTETYILKEEQGGKT